MTLRHEPDVSYAAWFADRNEPWEQLCSLGPSGFAQYARVLHVLDTEHGETEAQALQNVEGDLDDESLHRLVGVLARHTSTPDDCFFGLWDGFGDIHGAGGVISATMHGDHQTTTSYPLPPAFPRRIRNGPTVEIPARGYLLFRGVLRDAGQWGATPFLTPGPRRINSPNLIWPADRAWFVATEIDVPWTGVGGSAALVDDLTSEESLDVELTELTPDQPYWRS